MFILSGKKYSSGSSPSPAGPRVVASPLSPPPHSVPVEAGHHSWSLFNQVSGAASLSASALEMRLYEPYEALMALSAVRSRSRSHGQRTMFRMDSFLVVEEAGRPRSRRLVLSGSTELTMGKVNEHFP